MFFKKQNSELDKFAELLNQGVVALFKERGEIKFTSDPVMERKRLIEFDGRMRADGMEKFENEPTYVSAVNFYANEKDMEKSKTLGALIIYVEQTYIAKLMKMLRYPPIDDESDDAMRDSCGTLCNIVSGRFKSEISSAGYIELEMSHFMNYRNSAFSGVNFCYNEYDKYIIDFEIDKKKRLVIEMTMGAVPKR
ncbi:MAG: hypothetical protein KAR05_11975 [Candidatus Omnitrophica bacterium]|nr:hypothetical protein [Candidatus Omnitrophota bacterium]